MVVVVVGVAAVVALKVKVVVDWDGEGLGCCFGESGGLERSITIGSPESWGPLAGAGRKGGR
jgi:hypothetical protein